MPPPPLAQPQPAPARVRDHACCFATSAPRSCQLAKFPRLPWHEPSRDTLGSFARARVPELRGAACESACCAAARGAARSACYCSLVGRKLVRKLALLCRLAPRRLAPRPQLLANAILLLRSTGITRSRQGVGRRRRPPHPRRRRRATLGRREPEQHTSAMLQPRLIRKAPRRRHRGSTRMLHCSERRTHANTHAHTPSRSEEAPTAVVTCNEQRHLLQSSTRRQENS